MESQMTIEDVRDRLTHHANLPCAISEEESFCFLIWNAKRTRKAVDLSAAFRDIVGCLETLNKLWNGPVPSETPRERILTCVDRRIAYLVSEVMTGAAEYVAMAATSSDTTSTDASSRAMIAYGINCAWSAVLAGDIDDLQEHLRLEMRARLPGADLEFRGQRK